MSEVLRKGKVFFITGASHGFGYHLAEQALLLGYSVVATSRTIDSLNDLVSKYPDRIISLVLNVRVKEDIEKAVGAAISKFGHIDVLINNAGYNDIFCFIFIYLCCTYSIF
jgi:NADP-dependent 3-hydroxy acid dehydrogenase YdfG